MDLIIFLLTTVHFILAIDSVNNPIHERRPYYGSPALPRPAAGPYYPPPSNPYGFYPPSPWSPMRYPPPNYNGRPYGSSPMDSTCKGTSLGNMLDSLDSTIKEVSAAKGLANKFLGGLVSGHLVAPDLSDVMKVAQIATTLAGNVRKLLDGADTSCMPQGSLRNQVTLSFNGLRRCQYDLMYAVTGLVTNPFEGIAGLRNVFDDLLNSLSNTANLIARLVPHFRSDGRGDKGDDSNGNKPDGNLFTTSSSDGGFADFTQYTLPADGQATVATDGFGAFNLMAISTSTPQGNIGGPVFTFSTKKAYTFVDTTCFQSNGRQTRSLYTFTATDEVVFTNTYNPDNTYQLTNAPTITKATSHIKQQFSSRRKASTYISPKSELTSLAKHASLASLANPQNSFRRLPLLHPHTPQKGLQTKETSPDLLSISTRSPTKPLATAFVYSQQQKPPVQSGSHNKSPRRVVSDDSSNGVELEEATPYSISDTTKSENAVSETATFISSSETVLPGRFFTGNFGPFAHHSISFYHPYPEILKETGGIMTNLTHYGS